MWFSQFVGRFHFKNFGKILVFPGLFFDFGHTQDFGRWVGLSALINNRFPIFIGHDLSLLNRSVSRLGIVSLIFLSRFYFKFFSMDRYVRFLEDMLRVRSRFFFNVARYRRIFI